MYISTYTPLQSALSGIEAAQQELDVTSQNIANQNTPGYVAESVNLTETPPLTAADGNAAGGSIQIGTGVDALSITNNANQYLDASYRTQNASSSAANTQVSYLNEMQSMLNEPSTAGISSQLSTFWSAWSDLADNPTSAAAKTAVVADGTNLAQSLNQLSNQLSVISSQATGQLNSLEGAGGEVANDAASIAQLNTSIQQATAAGQDPNTLIDQRNKFLNDLSSLAKISVTNNSNGTVTVGFGDAAQALVSGSTVNWPQTITGASGGTLGALISLTEAGGGIAQYSSMLDTAAAALVSEVNGVTGLQTPFFSGTSASTIAVAVSASAVSATSSSTANPGGNDVATAEASLSGGTADQAYQSLVTSLGAGAQNAQNNARTQTALTTAIQNQQQSIEGVDISQEVTNMQQEQQAYQASAQVMNAFGAMMNALMSAAASA